jgi:hypothetical protein
VDRVAILCDKDRVLLREFSRKSLARVRGHPFLTTTLSFFPSYLERNVKKEVDKDQLIITEAATAFAAGRPACDLDLEDIFEKTRKIDAAFLDGLAIPAFSMTVRYSDFADIRIERIWRLARSVYALLGNWPERRSFHDAARGAYGRDDFLKILIEILHLYSLETRMLCDSLRSPFSKAIKEYAEMLLHAMEETHAELAALCTEQIYGPEARPCPNPI